MLDERAARELESAELKGKRVKERDLWEGDREGSSKFRGNGNCRLFLMVLQTDTGVAWSYTYRW